MISSVADVVMLTFCAVMIATHIMLCVGILLSRFREKNWKQVEDSFQPHLSIIIPARNEEKNLPALFDSLEKQLYDRFEVIFINDRSEDSTLEEMEGFKRRFKGKVTIISLKENPVQGNPKQYALSQGVERATGDILLFTDADCSVQPGWIKEMRKPFADPGIGVVFGSVYTRMERGFLNLYQTFDHVFRYFYTAGSAGIGGANGVYGNNMAIRKSLLDSIGGYNAIPYSVTEDNALITEIRHKTDTRIIGLSHPDIHVEADPQSRWKYLTSQELRWSSGAYFSPDFFTRFGYSLVKLYLAAGTIGALAAPWYPKAGIISLSTITSMSLIAVTGGIMLRMPFIRYWLLFLPNILWSMLYYLFVDAMALLKVPVNWKGNRLKSMK